MLNKLHYRESSTVVHDDFISKLSQYFTEKELGVVNIEPIIGAGTLSYCFMAKFDKSMGGGGYFIKTNIPGEYFLRNMEMQITLMEILYSDKMDMQSFSLCINNNVHCFFMMELLDHPSCLPGLKQIEALIYSCTEKLQSSINIEAETQNMYSIHDIVKESSQSLLKLKAEDFLDIEISNKCNDSIVYIQEYLNNCKIPCICHGDLSNKNILCTREKDFILIDWEDAFLGLKNYDIIYWLTFMDQRRFYSKDIFDSLGIEKRLGISLMSLIVLIKSNISLARNQKISLSFNDRLREIFSIY